MKSATFLQEPEQLKPKPAAVEDNEELKRLREKIELANKTLEIKPKEEVVVNVSPEKSLIDNHDAAVQNNGDQI